MFADQGDGLKEKVWNALLEVTDPEIPVLSVVDLGMIEEVQVKSGRVTIKALPTFMGCPALDIIQKNIEEKVATVEGVKAVEVSFIFNPPWTSDRVTEEGRKKLKEFGIAPAPRFIEEDGSWTVDCPYCGSPYTTIENIFGPTACRSLLYCKSCRNPFEAMKPVSTGYGENFSGKKG